jgi:hypothetical protein
MYPDPASCSFMCQISIAHALWRRRTNYVGGWTLQCLVVVARIRAKVRRIRLSELPDLDTLIRPEPTGIRATVTGHCRPVQSASLPLSLPTPFRTTTATTMLTSLSFKNKKHIHGLLYLEILQMTPDELPSNATFNGICRSCPLPHPFQLVEFNVTRALDEMNSRYQK